MPASAGMRQNLRRVSDPVMPADATSVLLADVTAGDPAYELSSASSNDCRVSWGQLLVSKFRYCKKLPKHNDSDRFIAPSRCNAIGCFCHSDAPPLQSHR